MSLPNNCPNEPGLYWAVSRAAALVGLKEADLLVSIGGKPPFLEVTVYKPFWHEFVGGLEVIGHFLEPCSLPGVLE